MENERWKMMITHLTLKSKLSVCWLPLPDCCIVIDVAARSIGWWRSIRLVGLCECKTTTQHFRSACPDSCFLPRMAGRLVNLKTDLETLNRDRQSSTCLSPSTIDELNSSRLAIRRMALLLLIPHVDCCLASRWCLALVGQQAKRQIAVKNKQVNRSGVEKSSVFALAAFAIHLVDVHPHHFLKTRARTVDGAALRNFVRKNWKMVRSSPNLVWSFAIKSKVKLKPVAANQAAIEYGTISIKLDFLQTPEMF